MGNQMIVVNKTELEVVACLEHVGPLHWKVLGPGERWDCSPGRGFYTLCARDARLAENLPTVAGAVLKPLAVAVGVAGAAGLMAIPFLGASAASAMAITASAAAMEGTEMTVGVMAALSAGSVVAASTAGGAAFFATSSDRYHASCSVKGVHVGSEPVVWVVTAAMVEGGEMQLVLTKREQMPAVVEQPPVAAAAAGGDVQEEEREEQEGMQTVEERAEAAAAAQGRAAAEVRRVLLLAGDDANTQDEGGEVEDEGYVLLDSTAFTVDGFLRYMGLAGGGEGEAAAAASSRAAADNTWTDAITDVVPVPRAGEASRA